jgi:hypothetical protein
LARMSGLHEVDCSACGRRHTLSAEQARKQRVLRCTCGQFIRMDRALTERRSEPAPAPTPAPQIELADADAEDEQTHLLSSLAAVAALSKQRAPQPSLSGAERKSQPPPRAPMPTLTPGAFRAASEPPPTDKPLWYVDLGGIETVEMTIEQLIIARRSGKLGEGALVWRTGMPSWRPVGTLIPAASRPTPTPPAPSAPPPPSPPPPPPPAPLPSRSAEPAPVSVSLGSYERPVATLEFALERPSSPPREGARPPTPPRRERSSPPPRAATPIPPRALTPLPPRAATPLPKPALWTTPTSVVAPLTVSSSVAAMAPVTLPPSRSVSSPPALERPRWLTASLAVLLCIAASGSGAFLVRTLRPHRQPLQLSPAPSTLSVPVPGSSAQSSKEPQAPAAPSATAAPQVVDITSLSVEHRAPRAVARPAALAPVKAPSPAPSEEHNDSDEAEAEPGPAATPTASQKPQNSDLPVAAHANPYPTGTLNDGTAKKAPSPGGDEPGF